MCRHSTNEFIFINALVQKERLKKKKHSKERKYTKLEINIVVGKKMKKALKKRKKQSAKKLCAYGNTSIYNSDEESNNIRSREVVEI